MWKSASASGSPWSRLTAVSLLMVSSVRTVGRERDVLGFLQRAMRAGFLDEDVVGNVAAHVRSAHAARVGDRIRRLRRRSSAFCSARRPRLSSNSAVLLLAARLQEQQAQQQHDHAREDVPVLHDRVENRADLRRRLGGAGVVSASSRESARARRRQQVPASGSRRLRAASPRAAASLRAATCRRGSRPAALGRLGLRGCCCEAASLACRSASSVLRSSSMRFDSVSWPSSSRTRLRSCVDLRRNSPLERPGLEAESLGGTRRRRPAPDAADAPAHAPARRRTSPAGFGRRNRGELFAAGNAQHGARAQAVHVAFEGAGVVAVDATMSWSVRAPVLADRRRAMADRLSPRCTS